MAAALGDEQAIATGVTPSALSQHYRTRIEQVTSCLTARQCIEFAFECARRALRTWEEVMPSDTRPRLAVEAVEAWLSGNATHIDFAAICNAAEQSHIDLDHPELTEDTDPRLYAALEAASACGHTALVVQRYLDRANNCDVCSVTAWVARFGVKAASDRHAESDRQRDQLLTLLLA